MNTQPPNKRLKLAAPGCGTTCVRAPANSVLLFNLRCADGGRRRSLSASR